MSDISIPGISNNRGMDTSQMVEDLMEVERIPVRRMESQVETYQLEQETWRSFGRRLSQLRDVSRSMYGFENPFRERLADVSNSSVLSADATRQAEEGIEELTVLETAGRDRFASESIPRDTRIEAGVYRFTLGDEEGSFRYGGGSLSDFVETLNDRVGDVVRAVVVPDTAETRVIIFEGQEEGAAAILGFEESAATLAQQIGVLSSPRPDDSLALFEDAPLRLEPGDSTQERLATRYTIEPGMVLRFDARTIEIPREPWTPPPPAPGPDLPEEGAITFNDVTIRNERLDLGIPEPDVPEEPPRVEDNRVVQMLGAGARIDLPAVPTSTDFRTVEVPAEELMTGTDGFVFTNRNTDRAIEIRNLVILDPSRRGGSRAVNALDTARDARIEYNGIEITRSSNTVDDLIPGVTLTLRRASQDPVEVDVHPDRESTKNAIIEFIGFYNQVVRDINIYTRSDPALIEQIEYFTDDERETMEERLGIFQGDSGLNQLRSRMQTIMMNAYDTGGDSTYRMLAQIGISTNASGTGGGYDASRLRGYLEINESDLDAALEQDFEAIGRLFGRDTDGDLVVDTGVGYALENYVAPYVRTGGIIASRTDSLDTRIGQTEDRIDRYNDRLEDYEADLRTEFGRMEGALDQLEESSRALDNLNTGNNNQ